MQRLEELRSWLASALPDQAFTLAPASADASFRRYFRVSFADGSPSRIVMDAPPEKEDSRPWLQVAELLRSAGAHVPEVLATDVERGFLLLSDLGSTTYLTALRGSESPTNELQHTAHLQHAANLYADALGTLAAIVPGKIRVKLPLIPGFNAEKNLDKSEQIAKKLGVSQIARINYIIPGKVCQD